MVLLVSIMTMQVGMGLGVCGPCGKRLAARALPWWWLVVWSAARPSPSVALDFAPAAAFGGRAHGLPPLPGGAALDLEAPGWTRGIGTGGEVWPSAGALCRYLSRTDEVRGKRVVELGCGTGAVGCFAAGLGAARVLLTDGGSDALRRVAAKNAARNAGAWGPEVSVEVRKACWGEAMDDAACDVVLGSDVTYDRDAHDRLCATVASLLRRTSDDGVAPYAVFAHQHRRLASFVSGSSQLDHFLGAADAAGLAVDSVDVGGENALAPVEILRITRR